MLTLYQQFKLNEIYVYGEKKCPNYLMEENKRSKQTKKQGKTMTKKGEKMNKHKFEF